MTDLKKKVAIIGAGMAGVTAAKILKDEGVNVTVFEKSRGVGGRMSTRRNEFGHFDHGAQYFTASEPEFQKVVDHWLKSDIAAVWPGTIIQRKNERLSPITPGTIRFVGTPYMNSPVIDFSKGLSIRTNCELKQVHRETDGTWQLEFVDTSKNKRVEKAGGFDVLIMSTPAPQAKHFLQPWSKEIDPAGHLEQAYHSVWATLIAFHKPLGLSFEGCFVNEPSQISGLSWVANTTNKPKRPVLGKGIESWILHGKEDWSLSYLEEKSENIAQRMLKDFSGLFSIEQQPIFLKAHRWRYARPKSPIEEAFLWHDSLGLGVCGDWCGGPKVQGAYLSGLKLAQVLLNQISP